MNLSSIKSEIMKRYDGLQPLDTWGETSYFYNPNNKLIRGTYFITVKEKDGDNDKASNLSRDRVYRINCGTTKQDFVKLFGSKPERPSKGGVIKGPWKFDKENIIMPHPVYGWAGWICVVNPNKATFNEFLKIADNYYPETVSRYNKKVRQ